MKTIRSNDGTERIMWRFLRMLVPVFVIAITISLYTATTFTFGNERNQLTARINNLAARTATAINSVDHNDFGTSTQPLLSLLIADPAISCAIVIDRTGTILSSALPRAGCSSSLNEAQAEVRLAFPEGARLRIQYNLVELEARSQLFRNFTLISLLSGFLIAVATAFYSFRRVVSNPLNALLHAIHETNQTGKPARVEAAPNDELGEVTNAFNEMQSKLEAEATSNAEALRRLDYVYNNMPALMFTMDTKGIIKTVSGHWLETTGHERETVSSVHFSQVLHCENTSDFAKCESEILNAKKPLRDIPFILNRKDGGKMHVMLAVVPDIDEKQAALLCVLSDISALMKANSRLERQASTDHLTGLANRQGLSEHLASMALTENDERLNSALLFIDLDNFKTVNDTLGHHAGDELLKAAMGRVAKCISKNDFLARLGGDEFAIVLQELGKAEDAKIVADRIVEVVSQPFSVADAIANVGASIGIATFTNGFSPEEVLRQADLAMYKSKQSGKNSWSVYSSDLTASIVARELMVQKIRRALLEDHFTFYIQPIVELATLRPVGAEALLRLNCPNDGITSPQEIIRAAEETGLIAQISAWGVAEGIRISNDEVENFRLQNRYLSVNISPKQVNRQFITELVNRLKASPSLARSMVFEITETALFKTGEDVAEFLQALRDTGARVALDDFGTGYSSLGHIHRYPVDLIKLDRSFLKDLGKNSEESSRKRGLVRATATMADELGIGVIAEGIEDNETLHILREYGVRYGQGYLFSPPLPLCQGISWLNAFGQTAPVDFVKGQQESAA